MDKLQVFALDSSMRRASGSIPYTTLLWSRRYYEVGKAVLEIPASIYDESWKYIYCPSRPETMIIEKVAIADTQLTRDGIDTITLSGRFLEALLFDYMFLVEETETERHYLNPPSPPAKLRFEPKNDAYISGGGYIYTYNSNGVLEGHAPAGADGISETKPLASAEKQPDGSMKVTDLAGAEYIVTPIEYHSDNANFGYKASEDNAKLHLYRDTAAGDSYDWTVSEYFTDGSGGTWYYSGNIEGQGNVLEPTWIREPGVTNRVEDTYYMRKRAWQAAIREFEATYPKDENGNYYHDVQVRGAWQRLETEDFGKEMDSVQQLMLWARMVFQNTLIFEEPKIQGEVKVLNPSLKTLGDNLYSELKTIGASCSIVYSFTEDAYSFSIWRGKDRTQSQTNNPWATFSDTWGTLYGYLASKDDSNYRNTCYVLYSCEIPVFGSDGLPMVTPDYSWDETGVAKTLQGWRVNSVTKRGYERVRLDDGLDTDRECYLDIRSENPAKDKWKSYYSVSEGKPTFSKSLKDEIEREMDYQSRGIAYLKANHPIENTLDTGTLKADDYIIKYDIGDKVDVSVSALSGFKSEARIIGVDESYDANDSRISLIIDEDELNANLEVSNG